MRFSKPQRITVWVGHNRASLILKPVGWGRIKGRRVYGVKIGVLRVSRTNHRILAGQKVISWR